ncbi:MAG: hypothetical protein NTX91_00955 [candidate division SR1 bacterium]|nr:hypothetical protein [candidate division SR1 bacterium]
MKNTRLTDLMIIGQLILLAGIVVGFLNETNNISVSLGATLINHIYWALMVIALTLISITSYDFVQYIRDELNDKVKGTEGTPIIHLLSVMGILGCLFFIGFVVPSAGYIWAIFCAIGCIATIIFYKEIKASHGMIWAILTMVLVLMTSNKWTFLENNAPNKKLQILITMVSIFIISFIVKQGSIKFKKEK